MSRPKLTRRSFFGVSAGAAAAVWMHRFADAGQRSEARRRRSIRRKARGSGGVGASEGPERPAAEPGPRFPVGPTRSLELPRGILIRPGDPIQRIVDDAPEGAVFILAAGIHAGQMITPKNGQQFWGQFGAVLDGQNRTAHAFDVNVRTKVQIKNLIIENYTPEFNTCVIEGGNSAWGDAECLEIRNNTGIGIRVGGILRRCHIHHNAQAGFSVYFVRGALIEDCELAFHNSENKELDGTRGGCKIWNSEEVIVRHNYSHDNYGVGIWADTNNNRLLIESNRVENNTSHGIIQEVGYAAVIRNNHVRGHRDLEDGVARGAIAIVKSRDVEVYGNVVTDNDCGIVILEEPFEDDREPAGVPWETRAARIHHNTCIRNKLHAGAISWGGDPCEPADDNRFEDNSYSDARSQVPFHWADMRCTWEQWRGYGHDRTGTYR